MRLLIGLGALLVGATVLTSPPAHATVSLVAVAKSAAFSAQQSTVQPVLWRWHGRRYHHRRWVRRHGWHRGHYQYW